MFNIALYQPDIPQNTAAIIRLCSCFDTTLEIIEPCGFHLDDKRLKKVAMDYLDKSKIITYKSYEKFLINKKKSRIILMTTKAKKDYYNFIFKPKDTILFGRESEGVPRIVHNKSYQRPNSCTYSHSTNRIGYCKQKISSFRLNFLTHRFEAIV